MQCKAKPCKTNNIKQKKDLPIRKLVDPLMRDQAQLGRKVRTINANCIGGHYTHGIARHDHRDGDGIELKGTRGGEEVRVKQLREGDRLEEQYVALEGAKVNALAHVVRRDVSNGGKENRSKNMCQKECRIVAARVSIVVNSTTKRQYLCKTKETTHTTKRHATFYLK